MKKLSYLFGTLACVCFVIMLAALFTTDANDTSVGIMLVALLFGCVFSLLFLYGEKINKPVAVLIICLMSMTWAKAQNAKLDASGNYVAVSLSASGRQDGNKPTGKTFTDSKGIKYPVMISKNGKLFYVRTSKNGNQYKVYIKL